VTSGHLAYDLRQGELCSPALSPSVIGEKVSRSRVITHIHNRLVTSLDSPLITLVRVTYGQGELCSPALSPLPSSIAAGR